MDTSDTVSGSSLAIKSWAFNKRRLGRSNDHRNLGLKALVTSICVIFMCEGLQAQNIWTTVVGRSLFDQAWSIIETSEPAYIAVGHSSNGHNVDRRHVGWLVKLNVDGDTLWTKSYGESDVKSYLWSATETSDSCYVLVGDQWSSERGRELWLVKTDTSGDTLWTKTYDNQADLTGFGVIETSDESFVIVGISFPVYPDESDYQISVVKTDRNGNALWMRTYGDLHYDESFSVIETSDNFYLIAGFSVSSQYCGLLFKMDASGDTLWSRSFDEYQFSSVIETSNLTYVVAGTKHEGSHQRLSLLETDFNGNVTWSRVFGENDKYSTTSLIETHDNSYVLSGERGDFYPDTLKAFLMKVDHNADSLWFKTYERTIHDNAKMVLEAEDGGLVFVGNTGSGGSEEGSDIWIVKTDSVGSYIPPVSIESKPVPSTEMLISSYPNPFNPGTSIEYELPDQSDVSVIIYDMTGREVNRLVSISQPPGSYKVSWNGADHVGRQVAGGMYFARLQAGDNSSVAKMVYLR